jgi:hypothetical protein
MQQQNENIMKSSRSNSQEHIVDSSLVEPQCEAIRVLLADPHAVQDALRLAKIFKVEALPGYRLNSNSQFKVRIANGYDTYDWLSHLYKSTYKAPAIGLMKDLSDDVYQFLCFIANHPIDQAPSTLQMTNELREAILFYAIACLIHNLDITNHAHLKELFMMTRSSLHGSSLHAITQQNDTVFKSLNSALQSDQTQQLANSIFDPLTKPVNDDYIKHLFLCLNEVDNQLTGDTLSKAVNQAIQDKSFLTVVLGDEQVGNVDLSCLNMMALMNDTTRNLLQEAKLWQQLYICAKLKVILEGADDAARTQYEKAIFLLGYDEIVSATNEQQFRHATYAHISCLPMPIESIRATAHEEMLQRRKSMLESVLARLESVATINDSLAAFDPLRNVQGVTRDKNGAYENGFDCLAFLFSAQYEPSTHLTFNAGRLCTDIEAAFNQDERKKYNLTKQIILSPIATQEQIDAIILHAVINYVQGSHDIEDQDKRQTYQKIFTGANNTTPIEDAIEIESRNIRCSEIWEGVSRSLSVATKSVVDGSVAEADKILNGKLGDLIAIIRKLTAHLHIPDRSKEMKAEVLKNAALILQSPATCQTSLTPYFEELELSICEHTLLSEKFKPTLALTTDSFHKFNVMHPALIKNPRNAALITCAIAAANYFNFDIQLSAEDIEALERTISNLRKQTIKLQMLDILNNPSVWFQLLIDNNFICPGKNEFSLANLVQLQDSNEIDTYIPNLYKVIDASSLFSKNICDTLTGFFIREQIYLVGVFKSLQNKYEQQGDGHIFNTILKEFSITELLQVLNETFRSIDYSSEPEDEISPLNEILSGPIEPLVNDNNEERPQAASSAGTTLSSKREQAPASEADIPFIQKHAAIRSKLTSIFARKPVAPAVLAPVVIEAPAVPAPVVIEAPAVPAPVAIEAPAQDDPAHAQDSDSDSLEMSFEMVDSDADIIDSFELADIIGSFELMEPAPAASLSRDLIEMITTRIGVLESEMIKRGSFTNLFFYRDKQVAIIRKSIDALQSVLYAANIEKAADLAYQHQQSKTIFNDKVTSRLLELVIRELNNPVPPDEQRASTREGLIKLGDEVDEIVSMLQPSIMNSNN